MGYEEIWQKIKSMSYQSRKMLAYEMTLKGFNVGFIHPHYYFDAKAVHNILFYPPNSQHEIKDPPQHPLRFPRYRGTESLGRMEKSLKEYYNALKEIIEDDKEIHVRVKRHRWLPRFINKWKERKIVKTYIYSRINDDFVNAWYRILPGKSIAGERPRSLFITLTDGSEVVYKMTECSYKDGYEHLTFTRTDN